MAYTVFLANGWRLDLGKNGYALRLTNGTQTNFSVLDGDIIAKSITLNQKDDSSAMLTLASTSGTHNAYVVEAFTSVGTRIFSMSEVGQVNTAGSIYVYDTVSALGVSNSNFRAGLDDSGQLILGDGLGGYGVINWNAGQFQVQTGVVFAWGDDSNPAKLKGDGTTGSGYIELPEGTAPAAPGANKVVLYAQDNGAGKTQLMARFNSGAAQQVAIQP